MTTAGGPVHDDFFGALLGDFLDEAGELLDRLNGYLLSLDQWAANQSAARREPCDAELMNKMFRAAHSFKGLSAMLGLTEINHLTHKVENVFDAARHETLFFTPETVELLFHALDRLSDMVQALHDPEPVEARCDELLREIEGLLADAGVVRGPSTQQEAEQAFAESSVAAKSAEHDTVLFSAAVAPPSIQQPPPRTGAVEIPQSTPADLPLAPSTAPGRHAEAGTLRNDAELPQSDPLEGVADESGIPAKYLSIFIDETESAIDTLTETLLAQESNLDASANETLLILSHRIKGSSASVGLNRMAKFAHLMEDLLQMMRETGSRLTADMTDVLLKCVDAMREYVVGLKQGTPDSSHFGVLCRQLIRLRSSSIDSAGNADDSPPTPDVSTADPTASAGPPISDVETPSSSDESSAAQTLAEIRNHIISSAPEHTRGVMGRICFQPGFPLVGMKARLLYEKLSQFGNVVYCDPAAEALELLDDLPHLDFGVETTAPVDEVVSQMKIVSVASVAAEAFQTTARPMATDAPSTTESLPAEMPQFAAATPQPAAQAAPTVCAAKFDTTAHDEPPAIALPETTTSAAGSRPAETLRVDIDRLDQLMNLVGQLVINKARFGRIGECLRQAVGDSRSSKSFRGTFAALEKITAALDEYDPRRAQQRELLSMRGLVRVIQNDLEAFCRDFAKLNDARASVSDLSEAVHQLDRVVDRIQRSVMDTRMVPIGPLFARFRRVVRDITRGAGKEILLTIRGEKTELDKRMIDELSDPLIHMVRNSADHGIEPPEERLAAGKPRQGTITLDAFHRGNSIIVQVTDDGRGLDCERILARAIERELVPAADAERLTTHQIQNLIWEPGFTTAEKVTEISGRGMGMDIVKSKIEEINGAVELESTYGEGTVFTVKLPLTLAILPSLMIEICGEVLAMPIESVVEIVSVAHQDVITVHGAPSTRVRGRVISIVRLDDTLRFHGIQPTESALTAAQDLTLVIIGCEGEEIGLAVDSVLGEEDIVIKSLAENYRNVQGIAGASILGDGRVSLILDVAALLEMTAGTVAAINHYEEQ